MGELVYALVVIGSLVVAAFLFMRIFQPPSPRGLHSIEKLSDAEGEITVGDLKKGDGVKDYYSRWAGEEERLYKNPAEIVERLRTESILKRHMPKAPAQRTNAASIRLRSL